MAQIRKAAKSDRFTIGNNDAGGSEQLQHMVGGQSPASQMTTEWVAIQSLKPDPENPRRLNMNRERLLADPATVENQQEREVLQDLRTLAQSILDDGLSNPIEVYALPGDAFRILAGERRYWASLYNWLTAADDRKLVLSEVRVTIYKTQPTRLRRKQLSENSLRADLSLSDQLHSVKAAYEELKADGVEMDSIKAFGEALYLPRHDARAWFPTLTKWPVLVNLVANGKITAISHLRSITACSDEVIKKLLPKISQYGFTTDLLDALESAGAGEAPPAPSKAPGARKGRPTVYFASAKVTPVAARKIIDAFSDMVPELKTVDWADEKAAKKAFEELIKVLNG